MQIYIYPQYKRHSYSNNNKIQAHKKQHEGHKLMKKTKADSWPASFPPLLSPNLIVYLLCRFTNLNFGENWLLPNLGWILITWLLVPALSQSSHVPRLVQSGGKDFHAMIMEETLSISHSWNKRTTSCDQE